MHVCGCMAVHIYVWLHVGGVPRESSHKGTPRGAELADRCALSIVGSPGQPKSFRTGTTSGKGVTRTHGPTV